MGSINQNYQLTGEPQPHCQAYSQSAGLECVSSSEGTSDQKDMLGERDNH